MQICHSPANVTALSWDLEKDTTITLTMPVPHYQCFYVALLFPHSASFIA